MWLGSKADASNRAVDSFRRNANPDFFRIQPVGPSSNIQLRQISVPSNKKPDDPIPLIEFVRVSPLYSRHKVVWIESADRLLGDATNSLLKTLEEPPEFVKIILTTNQISRIKPTILSRCLVVNCELPLESELREHFPSIPEEIRCLAEGAPGTLTRIGTNIELYQDIIDYTDQLVLGSKYRALTLAEDFRRLSDRLEDAEKLGNRTSNARTLELIGIGVSHRHGHRADVVRQITEAHRRVISNANPTLVLDAMIGKIVLRNNSGTK